MTQPTRSQIDAMRALPAAIKAANCAAEPVNEWADLWYFVMDEAPLEFERIVTTFSPAHWHSEAHKLMRERYPYRAPSPLVGADGGTTQGDTQHANQDR